MRDIYLEVGESYYISEEYSFSPSKHYPEYPWTSDTIQHNQNNVYDMVRNCLIGLELDKENIGNRNWNPFKKLISEGNMVLLKPNWVMHVNGNKKVNEHALDCLVTNPSVVRAICDYCIIALKGTGKIIIGDAPMQGCDLQELLNETGYNKMLDFYKQIGTEVQFCDFREYRSVFDRNKVIIDKEFTGQTCIEVELGNNSMHYSKDSIKQYQVSDYEKELTKKYHQNEKHSYSINQNILQADVIINICKPKCHRLAGITGALKNVVGITYNKACLPHRTIGSKEEGGDEYLKKSYIKKLISLVLSQKVKYEKENKLKCALLMRYIYGGLYYWVKFFKKDKNLIGSWYGNDTIWRTVLDLNYILKYADKNGIINNKEQRKTFNFADMIIAGQGNGPVSPEPKQIGVIIAGNNPVVLDRVICEIMGFDYLKIPGLLNAIHSTKLMSKSLENCYVESNISEYCGAVDKICFSKEWDFCPHDSWKGHIEK
ncbi:DUF362 domain-containing protein [Clostridium tagluense]|uniref:DUF362 domain-containing protein n=1 Tax=Clostridium tagluense TaxID=360422 RepID=UPI001CF16AEF|nr:DUF362 domain-containing protein [Clostridium tagluense]MCB2296775.1 DUF362 domain-containing protein [Clostridium tagluense]